MSARPARTGTTLCLVLAFGLAACGQKGPLYLPDTTQGEVVTRPSSTTQDGATTGPANSPATPDDPGRSASPAPEVTAPAGTPADGSKDDPKKDDKKQPPK
ncbi:MAG TPA: lipoprotein [Steroidobacteraceae bacterium]|nr:lipoprotein [Steroidobacteraceae bacterium]